MQRTDRLADEIERYVAAIRHLQHGDYTLDVAQVMPGGVLAPLGEALSGLARALDDRAARRARIDQIVQRINAGVTLDEILDRVYEDFRDLIPYNRMGLSLIEDDGQTVRARWAKTDQETIHLQRGYEAPLASSSLNDIVTSKQPRILNDLEDYLRHKPDSESTQLMVAEGIRSSLTCPLLADGNPIGFLFFSSIHPGAYRDAHVETFMHIADHLAISVARGRLVSELAEQKRAIERQNRELQRLSELKTTFLGIAVHDLRSPLGLIEMAIALLLDPTVDIPEEERNILLRDVLDQSRHMLDLIHKLLDVTELEMGKLDLQREPVALAAFLTETVARHGTIASPKGTCITLEDPPAASDTVRADPLRLRQVMDNLLSNAVKYSPAGSTVTVRAAYLDGYWRISVQDEGPGILPNERDQLFEPFGRLSARPTGGERSTGLGLTIARRVVEAHGGQIGVDSVPGEGATFWFTLPA